jgi:hypothetical protein
MGLGMSLKMEVGQNSDEANALNVVSTRLSRPPQKVVKLLGVVGVTYGTVRKMNQGCNRIISKQQGRIINLYIQRVERVKNSCLSLTIEPLTVQGTWNLRRNSDNNFVRVKANAKHA